MNTAEQNDGRYGRTGALLLCSVIALSCIGYFVGIRDGAPSFDAVTVAESFPAGGDGVGDSPERDDSAMAAVSYGQMRRRQNGPTSGWKPTLEQIPQPSYDLFAEIKPSESDKRQSTLTRASRRAFNGAPPVIPHAVEQTADAACYACHGKGLRIGDHVANQMSHGFLANCTQCHAPPPPPPLANVDATVQNSFVGMPAPTQGQRAFPGAPPTIPHSTWMRQTCLSCHGNEAGWSGLQSTHPWRINCQQCHAPSATLDQAIVPGEIGFLPAIDVQAE